MQFNMIFRGPVLLRIVFPTVSQNTSPSTLLPNFLEVLGRKVDSLEDHLDPTCFYS